MEWQQPSRLPTTSSRDICMPACKLHKHQQVSLGLSHLIKRVVWARRGRRKSLSRYAVENRWQKRQQLLKKWSLWKRTKGNWCTQPERPFWRMYATVFWATDLSKVWSKSRMRATYIVDVRNPFNRFAHLTQDFPRLHLSSAADDKETVSSLHIHLFSNVLHRPRRVSPRRSMCLLIAGSDYCVIRFAYAL